MRAGVGVICETAQYRAPTLSDQAAADARLIAAAPELLAALQHALERFEAIPDHRDEMGIYRQSAAIARAAIARATVA